MRSVVTTARARAEWPAWVGDADRLRRIVRLLDGLIDPHRGDDVIFGESGSDFVEGGRGADEVHGGAGTDHVEGDGGDDLLYGGDDADGIYDEGDIDFIQGDLGQDVIEAGSGDDWSVNSGAAADDLDGDVGDDQLDGDSGNDYLEGGGDCDICYEGTGSDTFHSSCESGFSDFVLAALRIGVLVVLAACADQPVIGAEGTSRPVYVDLSTTTLTGDALADALGIEVREWGAEGCEIWTETSEEDDLGFCLPQGIAKNDFELWRASRLLTGEIPTPAEEGRHIELTGGE